MRVRRLAGVAVLTAAAAVSGGCSAIAGSAASDLAGQLSAAILDQPDPKLVRDGLPAYLLLLDGLASDPRAGPDTLGAAARLYSAFAVLFVDDPARAALLGARARDYGERALCAAAGACGLGDLSPDEFAARVGDLGPKAGPALLAYAASGLAFVRTHSGDWQAIAELPKLERVLERLLDIAPAADRATVHGWLGVLNSLRPPALGGQPERGRAHFEQAIELTQGRDLALKVEFARQYARLTYDRELHDRLLGEVLAADPRVPGHTLLNTLAQREARTLLDTADEYF